MAGIVLLVDDAREKMGVVGIGKATLKCGSESVAPKLVPGNPAGGDRLSGDALGGVSGAA